ncbi:hypothetical protein [Brevundimonas diminuta]|uniref:hypothetical protein n=1 Tax=Brevundimonas diminuta TaxID=293 RepID=UPI003F7EF11A
MAGNALKNCGFLDLAAGWEATGGVLAVDEASRGAPGRAALTATRAAAGALMIRTRPADRAPTAGWGGYEAMAAVAALNDDSGVAVAVLVEFFDAGGAVVEARSVDVQPARLARHGLARAGLRITYGRAFDRGAVPPAAVTAGLSVQAQGATSLSVVKPMLAPAQAGRSEPLAWDPGPHDALELNRPRWPSILRAFASGPGAEPQADRTEFAAATGRPMARRTTASAARKYADAVRCDPVERAELEAFHASVGDFWFVEPDTDRLCLASFAADGAPRLRQDLGEVALIDVALWLETA